MLILNKREELKQVLQRKSFQHQELSTLQRSALMQLDSHTTEELQYNQKSPGGSPAHIRINLHQFEHLPKIEKKTCIKTNKYIGEYNNMLGIITSKHQIPYRSCTYRSASHHHNGSQFVERQNYIINQFIRPRKLGACK